MRRSNWQPSRSSYLCSAHFTKDDYIVPPGSEKKTKLKISAVPSIFNFPQHLQKQSKSRKSPKKRSRENDEDTKSASPPSPTKRQKIIGVEHSYAQSYCTVQTQEKKLKKTVKSLKQKTRRLKKRNRTLKGLLKNLREQNKLAEEDYNQMRQLLWYDTGNVQKCSKKLLEKFSR